MKNLISTTRSVATIMEEFEGGDVGVPEIQRDVVWKPEDVRELLDSIIHEFPCGSLIYWEPREKDKELVRSFVRPERAERNGKLPQYFLLDGQQRVTALACVMLKREKLKELLAEVDEDMMPLVLVNMKRFPEELQATKDSGSCAFPWVKFNDLFDGTFQMQKEYAELPARTKDLVGMTIQRVRDYQFPLQIISNRDYRTVGEIFTRVNSDTYGENRAALERDRKGVSSVSGGR